MIVKTRKPKTEFQRTIIRLGDLYSEYIRRRAIMRGQRCERCAMLGVGVILRDIEKDDGGILPAWRQLQTHHFFTCSNYTTRRDPHNGVGVCGGCHTYVQRNPEANKELLVYLLPDARDRELLYVLTNMTTKQCPIDYRAAEIYLRQQIVVISQQGGINGRSNKGR